MVSPILATCPRTGRWTPDPFQSASILWPEHPEVHVCGAVVDEPTLRKHAIRDRSAELTHLDIDLIAARARHREPRRTILSEMPW